jgi:glycosyltransferase involved in cell wall biosynthesis
MTHTNPRRPKITFMTASKLLFVVNDPDFFLSHRLPLAESARNEGFDVQIATMGGGGAEKIDQLGYVRHVLPLSRCGRNPFKELVAFYSMWHLFRHLRPDLVHLVTIKPVLFGGVAARLAAVPCVVAAISGLGFVFISRGINATIQRWLARWLYRLALGHQNLKVIFQNEDDRESLVKLSHLLKEKTSLIRGSGVDLVAYSPLPLPEGVPVVVLAARLLADKGVREFVQAARVLKKGGSVARFVLVGKPDPGNPATISDNELKQWVSEEVIEWWGYSDDIPQVFASSTMVVLPSYYGEGLPKVLIEAAACGRAVITTDHPGCRDAIEPDVTGLLVPVRDSHALANAIKRLLNNPSLCEEIGRAGRKLAERSFDVRQVIAQHMHIYDELLQRAT